MAKKYIAALIGASIFLLGVIGIAIAVPYVYYSRAEQKRYEQDVEDAKAVAIPLGFSKETHIDIHLISHFLTHGDVEVVFYSTDILDQFSDKVSNLGLKQLHFFESDISTAKYFLELQVNRGSPEKLVTLSGLYTQNDFQNGGAPQVSKWNLVEKKGRLLSIYYAQPTDPQQIWLYGDQPLPGNIVVVDLNRAPSVATPSDKTGWILMGYALLVWVGAWGVLGLIIFSLWWARRKTKQ